MGFKSHSVQDTPSCRGCINEGLICRGKVGLEAKCNRCSYGRKVCIVSGIRAKGNSDKYGKYGDLARARARDEGRWLGELKSREWDQRNMSRVPMYSRNGLISFMPYYLLYY